MASSLFNSRIISFGKKLWQKLVSSRKVWTADFSFDCSETVITGCAVAPALLLTATGFVNGRWQFSTPHRIHTPWPITKKFVASDYVGDPYSCAKFGANPSTGGFWANGWNITKIFFIYLFIPFFSWTHLQVRPADGFSGLMAQTTRTRARMCLLGVSLRLLPISGVKSPENFNFWGVNGRFQAKRAKFWKFHVIETTASISTKFCTTIETLKWSSWVVPIGAQQIHMADGRHFEKTVKSLYLCNRLTDFDKIWYSDAYWPLTADLPLKFRIFNNPKWRRRPSWKITKIAISP